MPEGYPYPEHCPGLVKSVKKQLRICEKVLCKAKQANPNFFKDLGLTEKVNKRMKRKLLRCPYCVREKFAKKSNNVR